MTRLKPIYLLCFAILLFSCNINTKKPESIKLKENSNTTKIATLTKSEEIINKTITAHGGDLYDSANYSFIFRENTYHFKNEKNNFEYKKTSIKNNVTTVDILFNNNFSRTIDGNAVQLSNKDIAIASNALNSVIYFAALPYKLNDKAVNSKYIESLAIYGKNYHVIEITFNKEGGGEDHDDEFYYWINKDTYKIDYLAYNYKTNNGGVRFRSAYNSRIINGITFQDYINYKAKVGTPLQNLPALYEAKKLEEVSKIKTEYIINLNTN